MLVKLKDKNPYKDTIKGGKHYQVLRQQGDYYRLIGDTGQISWYDKGYFVPHDWSPTENRQDDEYWDIMRSQELMENLK